jgi:hypothetical protein
VALLCNKLGAQLQVDTPLLTWPCRLQVLMCVQLQPERLETLRAEQM